MAKGIGLLISLGIALYGVMKGASALIVALNIAYDEEESRSFIRLNLLSRTIAAGGVFLAILAMIGIAGLSALSAGFSGAPPFFAVLITIVSYLLIGPVSTVLAAVIYRFGLNRAHAKWRWLTPGSLFASFSWMLMTFGFGLYVANFGNYDATYGSLGAAMVLLTWLYLSAYVLLLGAELNCELERQTSRDTTAEAELPLGKRAAYVQTRHGPGSPQIDALPPAFGHCPAPAH